MGVIQSHLFDTDFVGQQQQASNYVDQLRQRAAKYQAGGQYAQRDYTGAAQTQAQAGDIPAAQVTQQYTQQQAAKGQAYLAAAIPTFKGVLDAHTNDPDGGAAAMGRVFDFVAQHDLTGMNPQRVAQIRQFLVSNPRQALTYFQSQLPPEFQKAGDTVMEFRGGEFENAYRGGSDQVVNGKLVDVPFSVEGPQDLSANSPQPGPSLSHHAWASRAASDNDGQVIPAADPNAMHTVESGNNPAAVSSAGAVGVAQTMPGTLASPGFGVAPAANNSPGEQQRVGDQYLQAMQAKYNNPVLAHIAYDMGPGSTDRWLAAGGDFSKLPAETQQYLGRIAVAQAMQGRSAQPQSGGVMGQDQTRGAPQVQTQQRGARVIYDGGPIWRQPTPAEAQQYPGVVQINNSTGETRYAPAAAQTAGQTAPGNTALTGDAYLKSLSPSMQSLVKAYSDGRAAIPTAAALRNPTVIQALMATAQYDPSFDQANYPSRAKTRADFTSGKSAQNIRALNTAIGHLGTLDSQISATASGSLTPINSVENYVSQLTGHAGITNYNQTAAALASELTAVFRGTGGAEADLNRNLAQLTPNASEAKKRGAVKNITDLLKSRLDALGDQYTQGMGKIVDPLKLLDSKAAQVLTRLSGGAAQGGSQQGAIPIMQTPQGALRLPSGTRFRTPDGRVKVRP